MDKLDFGKLVMDGDKIIIKDQEAIDQLKDKQLPATVKIEGEVNDDGK